MPSKESMERAAARRQAKAAQKSTTEELLAAETQELAKATEKQRADRDSGKTANAKTPSEGKAKAASRADRRAAQKAAANRQAEADVRVVPEPVKADTIADYLSRGETPPLHVLNAMAKATNKGLDQEAREMANAIGKVAYDQAKGKVARNRHGRIKRMNDALDTLKAAQAQTAEK